MTKPQSKLWKPDNDAGGPLAASFRFAILSSRPLGPVSCSEVSPEGEKAMKDLYNDFIPTRPEPKAVQLGFLARFFTMITGSSLDELGFVPDGERRAVGLGGFAILLVFLASAIAWWVALGFARGEYALEHLPFVLLAGCLVAVIDRAMLRHTWQRAGMKAVQARNFEIPEGHGGITALVIHWLMRVAVSLILGLTTAGFLELALFENDVNVHLSDGNRSANAAVFKDAAERVDTAISRVEEEITQIDAQVTTLLADGAEQQAAARDAAVVQIHALDEERAVLTSRITQLTMQIDCMTLTRVAEAAGGLRCDGTEALPGEGPRFEAANELLDHNREERARAEGRLATIDADMLRLQQPVRAGAAAIDEGLARLASRRAALADDLARQLSDRDRAVSAIGEADERFVQMPEGLIIRGEALEEMADSSTWLETRIWLIFLAIAVLDFAAVLVIALQPAPLALVVSEIIASEVAAYRAIARGQQNVGVERLTALRAVEEVRVETARISKVLSELATAEAVRQHFDGKLAKDLEMAFAGNDVD